MWSHSRVGGMREVAFLDRPKVRLEYRTTELGENPGPDPAWSVGLAVVSAGCSQTLALGEVDWSPDGQWLAYEQATSHGSTIWKVRADGTQQTFLTSGAGISPEPDAHSPAWSPDGSKIAFSSSSSLYTMDTDGNNVQSIVEGVGLEPSWHPVP